MFNYAALIVTYGDRRDILFRTIFAVLRNKPASVVVFCQGVTEEYKSFLEKLSRRIEIINVIFTDYNRGPAYGFAEAIKYSQNNCNFDYYLLLDDDLVLDRDWSNNTRKVLNVLDGNNHAISSYRVGRGLYDQLALRQNNIKRKYNEVLNKSLFVSLISKLHRYYYNTSQSLTIIANIDRAPFGGLVLPKKVLNLIGYPREDFVLYADDHEWSYRMREMGIPIFFSSLSKIYEYKGSTISNESTRSCSFKGRGIFNIDREDYRVFYECRNHLILSRQSVNNRLVYYLNFISVIFVPGLELLLRRPLCKYTFARLKTILAAIKEAKMNKLGVNNDYLLFNAKPNESE